MQAFRLCIAAYTTARNPNDNSCSFMSIISHTTSSQSQQPRLSYLAYENGMIFPSESLVPAPFGKPTDLNDCR